VGNRFWRVTLLIIFAMLNLNCSSTPHRKPASIPNKKNGLYLVWPIAKPKVSQEFIAEDDGSHHDGIDIAAPKGTRIYAPADGRVVYAGQKFSGYGKMIIIEHNSKTATLYGHCHKLLVKSGELIKRGSLIGLVGKTGRATAPHLHFEIRVNKKPVDPLEYLP